MPLFYNNIGRRAGGNISWFDSVIKKIIIANIAVFIIQNLPIGNVFNHYFALSPKLVITKGYVWQTLTYMFLHGDFFHVAFNMFIFWMFGSPLEELWGSNRFFKYYLICGLGGAAFSFIFAFNHPVIGASGAVYGILLAYAVLFPHNEIYVWGLFPVRARTLVIVLALIEFLSGVSRSDGIAHFAHLGGMAAGLLYMRTDHRAWRVRGALKNLMNRFPLKISMDGGHETSGDDADEPGKIDSILDKIHAKGYDNLNETEKRILENYSDKKTKH